MIQSVFIFLKAQISAFIGGLVDYFSMIFFTEVVGIFYANSIVISGLIGAVVNFSINRNWTFQTKNSNLKWQLTKFSVVVLGSIFFKSTGTYLLTNYLEIDYKITRILVDAIVSFGYNYPVQRFWVFKKNTTDTTEG